MNQNIEMLEQRMRVMNRRPRHDSTSSEEEQRKRSREAHGSIEEDLWAIFQEPPNDTQPNTYTQHTHTYTPHPYTAPINTYTLMPTDTNIYQPQTCTCSRHTGAYASTTQSMHVARAVEDTSRKQQESSAGYRNPQVRKSYTDIALEKLLKQNEKLLKQNDKLLKQLDKLLKSQEKVLQPLQQQHRGIPSKPAFLPISSLAGMTEFQNMDDDSYRETVRYLEYLGGDSLKQAVALCSKEVFTDTLLLSYSWLGRKDNKEALCLTRAADAIHDAVLNNRHFPKPSRREVAGFLIMMLRAAKERVRSRRNALRYRQEPTVANRLAAKEKPARLSYKEEHLLRPPSPYL